MSASRRLLPYGERAVLLECADLDEALGLMGPIGEAGIDEVVEIVPGARTLLLRLRRPLSEPQRRRLLTLEASTDPRAESEPVTIRVRYDGEDLEEVARLCSISADEVVALHTTQTWTVGFCGFAPGFGYLHGEHDRLRVPRRDTPRTEVPAGSVALADQWSGIYPRRGPGGWQLIGTTDQTLWDLDARPPALLRPRVRVRFEQQDTAR